MAADWIIAPGASTVSDGLRRPAHRARSLTAARACVRPRAVYLALALTALSTPAFSVSNKVRITNLNNVSFGTIANLSVDAVSSQNVCIYADTTTNGYYLTASGTGPGGAFALASGTASLPYDVQWSSSPGQTAGTQLTASVPLTGQVSPATQQTCNNGAASTASLVVVLRSTALSSAKAGTYSGTLTLVVGPE